MIALDCQPLSLVDNIGFVRVLHAAEPRLVNWHFGIYHHPLLQYHQSVFFQQLVTYMIKKEIDWILKGQKSSCSLKTIYFDYKM